MADEFQRRKQELKEQIHKELRVGNESKASFLVDRLKGMHLTFKMQKEDVYLKVNEDLQER